MRLHRWLRDGLLAAGVVALSIVASVMVRRDANLAESIRELAPALAVTLAALVLIIGRELQWRAGCKRLVDASLRIRIGRSANSELTDGGLPVPLMGLADELRRVAIETKRQGRRLRSLDMECNLRLTRQTDELQRELGTWRHKAHRDALTGLGNRAAFEELYRPTVERAIASGRELSVVMIDIDHFKALNDTLGHPAGDSMLRDIGRLIRSAVREVDGAFRYGGDEFVLVLDGASSSRARGMAERLSRLVDELAKPLQLSRSPGLSCGVAALSDSQAPNAEALIAAADADCYRVKQQRRAARAA